VRTEELISVYNEFKDHVSMITVYIHEAHALDEWAMFSDVCFKSPKTIKERISLAKMYLQEYALPGTVLVDTLNNDAMNLYSAWPERLYIVRDGIFTFKGELGPQGYKPVDVGKWLRSNIVQ